MERLSRSSGRVWADFQKRPWRYDFWQALALARSLRPRRRVRFSLPPKMGFSPAPVAALNLSPDGDPTLVLNLTGLGGPEGPLPPPLTELAESLARRGDPALADFFSLLADRVIDLYQGELSRLAPKADPDGHSLDRYVLAAAGVLGEGFRGRGVAVPCAGPQGDEWGKLPESSFLTAAAVWGLFPRSASGLEFLVEKVFGVRAKVEPLKGAWLPLPEEHRSRLGRARHRLGRETVSGGHMFDPAAGFTLRLGPLSPAEYRRFLPPPAGTRRGDLLALARWYVGESAFHLELKLQ